MALLFTDSFDHYANADILGKWSTKTAGTGGDTSAIVAGVGRRGTQGLRLSSTTTDASARYLLTPGDRGPAPSGPTCIAGFSWQPAATFDFGTSTTEGLSSATLFAVTYLGTTQVWFKLNNTGTIAAYRGTTLLGTSTFVFSGGATDYWEFLVTISATVGVVQLRKNAALDATLNLSGQNTRGSSADLWDQIAVGHIRVESIAGNFVYDDFYLLDGTTSADDPRNSFLGDCRCDATYPDAVGTDNDSTPSGGAVDRYTMVDEALEDGDTTYNTFASAGNRDSYNYPAAPVTGATIYGIQSNGWMRKEDAGVATARLYTRLGGTRYFGSSKSPGTSYSNQRQVWAQKPSDSSDWSDSDYNGAEFGFEKET